MALKDAQFQKYFTHHLHDAECYYGENNLQTSNKVYIQKTLFLFSEWDFTVLHHFD